MTSAVALRRPCPLGAGAGAAAGSSNSSEQVECHEGSEMEGARLVGVRLFGKISLGESRRRGTHLLSMFVELELEGRHHS